MQNKELLIFYVGSYLLSFYFLIFMSIYCVEDFVFGSVVIKVNKLCFEVGILVKINIKIDNYYKMGMGVKVC